MPSTIQVFYKQYTTHDLADLAAYSLVRVVARFLGGQPVYVNEVTVWSGLEWSGVGQRSRQYSKALKDGEGGEGLRARGRRRQVNII